MAVCVQTEEENQAGDLRRGALLKRPNPSPILPTITERPSSSSGLTPTATTPHTHPHRAMALDDNDSTSSAPPSSSLPVPPSSASSSRTDSKVPSVGSAVAPVALDVGSVGSGGGSSGEGAGGAIRGQEVVETKSACTKGSMAEAQGLQSDLEKGESGGGSRGPPERAGALKAGATPSLSWTSSSSRRFKLWGRGKARSWPTVLPNDEEGGKWEGGWGEKGGEAKEEGEARGEAYGPPESPPSISVLSSLQSSMHDMVGRIEARLHQVRKGGREGGFERSRLQAENEKERAAFRVCDERGC